MRMRRVWRVLQLHIRWWHGVDQDEDGSGMLRVSADPDYGVWGNNSTTDSSGAWPFFGFRGDSAVPEDWRAQ
jgi:hypothetical protein